MNVRLTHTGMLVRLERGEKLIESLNSLAKERQLQGVWLQGLGGAEAAILGFYDLEAKEYRWREWNQLLEITSLQGNLAWQNDEPVWHVHGSFSDGEYRAVGGHVKELVVGGTCELHLTIVSDDRIERVVDENTGLNLLSL